VSVAPSPFYAALGDVDEVPLDEFRQDRGSEPEDAGMESRVRAVVERARASQPPVTTRRLESVEAAPSEAQGAPFDEQAGSAPVPSSPPPAVEESVRPAVPPPATPAGRRLRPDEAAWRREAIVEWVAERGEALQVEIRDQFSTTHAEIARLEQEGRLERTGEMRPRPPGTKPSPVLRVPDPDPPSYGEPIEIPRPSHAQTGDAEAEQPAAEAPRGDAADDDRTIEEGHTDEQEEPAAVGREVAAPTSQAVTVGAELTVRYVRSLIGWIERGTMTREQAAPDHVLDRIERILDLRRAA
jgi:hypothetical protein